MNKVILTLIAILFLGYLTQAQTLGTKPATKFDLSARAADHFMFQFGSDSWTNKPDSVKTGGGFSRHFNAYFMYDIPFKSNQHYSVAVGAGLGTSNIFFNDHTAVDIRSTSSTLPFKHLDSTANHFVKNKLTTIYFQAPVELRYYTNPENPSKSWKYAAGLKIGTLVKAYTKSKNYVNAAGNPLFGKSYIEKRSSNRFFSTTDIALTGRVGYGLVSFDLGYQVTGVIRDGLGPVMNKFSFGLTISGL